jgi:lipoate-protein ligase B
VSYHGFALNVRPDLGCFDLIHPCGLRGITMTSLASRLGARAPEMAAAGEAAAGAFVEVLGYGGADWKEPQEAWAAAGEEPPPPDRRVGRAQGPPMMEART